MTVIAYEIILAQKLEQLAQIVNSRLPTQQPFGPPIVDRSDGMYCQAMVSESDGLFVEDGYVLEGVEPTGEYTDTVTFTIEGGAITGIALS